MALLKMNKVEEVRLDTDDSNQLVKLLDMALVLMEGGTEADFKSLEDSKDSESMDNGEEKAEEEAEVKEEETEKPYVSLAKIRKVLVQNLSAQPDG